MTDYNLAAEGRALMEPANDEASRDLIHLSDALAALDAVWCAGVTLLDVKIALAEIPTVSKG